MILKAGKLNNENIIPEAIIKKFIKEEDVASSKPSVISVIPTVKNLKNNKKERRKKRKKLKGPMPAFWQGLFTGSVVFFSIILIVVLAVAFIVVPIVQKWLNNAGIPDFETVFALLDDAGVTVKEESSNLNESMTTKSFTRDKEQLYIDAVNKAKQAGLDIFTGYDFTFSKLEDITNFNDIYLTDRELGATFLKSYNNFISFLNMGLINELNINFRLCELKLEKKDDIIYNINFVAEVIAPNIRDQMGTLSILIPEKIYIVINMDAKNTENGNLEFFNEKIGLNKYSEKSLQAMFDIIMSFVRVKIEIDESGGKLTPNKIAEYFADLLEFGINQAADSLGGYLTIAENIPGYNEPVFRISYAV